MARARRSGRGPDYSWTTARASTLALTAANAGVTLLTANESLTLMRLRGELLVWLDGQQAAGDSAEVAVGIIQMPADTGTTVTNDVFGDPYAPWIWTYMGALACESSTLPADAGGVIQAARIPIDSKAMRKMKTNEEIQVVFSNLTLGGATPTNFYVALRALTAV